MSDFVPSAHPTRSTPGRARATLGALMKRWGAPANINPAKPPDLIYVRRMEGPSECWRRLGTGTGLDCLYEQIE